MFRSVPVSTIMSFSLYTQQWYMSYRFCFQLASRINTELVPSWSCRQKILLTACEQDQDGTGSILILWPKPVWHILLLCVQWKTPDDGQRNCSKHVEFYSKNKFKESVHLVGFIIRTFGYYCKVFGGSDWHRRKYPSATCHFFSHTSFLVCFSSFYSVSEQRYASRFHFRPPPSVFLNLNTVTPLYTLYRCTFLHVLYMRIYVNIKMWHSTIRRGLLVQSFCTIS